MTDDEFEALTADDRQIVSLMRSLRENKGWQYLVEELKAMLGTRRDHYELIGTGGIEEFLNREFLRGEISMLRLLIQIPEEAEEGSLIALKARQQQFATGKVKEDDGYDSES